MNAWQGRAREAYAPRSVFHPSQSRRAPYHAPEHGGSRTLAGLTKRSFSLAGHRTSVALEAEFWDVLRDIARSRGMRIVELVAAVDAARDGTTPLASSLRVLALRDAVRRASLASPSPNMSER
jgi:predicted DNA-binding ribbon-helix-helix protein